MADINFNSDKIVFIFYKPGAGGEFINRLIHFSKELPAFEPPVPMEQMFQFNFAHNGQQITSANCHGTDNIWIDHVDRRSGFPYDYTSVQETIDHIKQHHLDRFVKYINEDKKWLLFRAHSMDIPSRVFPNTKTIYISIDDQQGKYFQLRARFEKILKVKNPSFAIKQNRKHLYRFLKNKSIIENEWISKSNKTKTFDEIQGDKFKIILSKILSKDRDEYNRLCRYLNITPSPHYEKFVDAYIAAQWKRRAIS